MNEGTFRVKLCVEFFSEVFKKTGGNTVCSIRSRLCSKWMAAFKWLSWVWLSSSVT